MDKNIETPRKKLADLGLSKKIVSGVMSAFENYLLTKKTHSKPSGIIEFKDNLTDIESLSKKLSKKLQKLTTMERQLLSYSGAPKIRELAQEVFRLSVVCGVAKEKKVKFRRGELFLSTLTLDLWEELERNKISVTVYRNNILCSVLNILLDETQDSERGLNLLRDVSKRFKKKSSQKHN
jgi:hypothetical protein